MFPPKLGRRPREAITGSREHKGRRGCIWTLVALGVVFSTCPALAQTETKVVSVSVRPGVTMQYLEITAKERPRAVVVLMAGGKGVLRLRPSGDQHGLEAQLPHARARSVRARGLARGRS